VCNDVLLKVSRASGWTHQRLDGQIAVHTDYLFGIITIIFSQFVACCTLSLIAVAVNNVMCDIAIEGGDKMYDCDRY